MRSLDIARTILSRCPHRHLSDQDDAKARHLAVFVEHAMIQQAKLLDDRSLPLLATLCQLRSYLFFREFDIARLLVELGGPLRVVLSLDEL